MQRKPRPDAELCCWSRVVVLMADERWNKLKEVDSFMCSMTLAFMEDPVMTSDGQSYERAAIEEWLSTNDTSPVTGAVLANKALISNIALKRAISEFRSNPETKQWIDEIAVREYFEEESFPPEEQVRLELLIVGVRLPIQLLTTSPPMSQSLISARKSHQVLENLVCFDSIGASRLRMKQRARLG